MLARFIKASLLPNSRLKFEYMTNFYRKCLLLSARIVGWLLLRLWPENFPVERAREFESWKSQLSKYLKAQ
jgi:hypothetical protein